MFRTCGFWVALSLAVLPIRAAGQTAEELAYVTGLFTAMNSLSIRFDREVCGFILRDPDGSYRSTKVSWGDHATCASLPLAPGVEVVSSWHTHASHSPDYDNEVPSIQDVEGDISVGVNGWVSTPGGRIWHIDGASETLRVVCGPDCLPSDPDATDAFHEPVPPRMTLNELYDRFGRARQ